MGTDKQQYVCNVLYMYINAALKSAHHMKITVLNVCVRLLHAHAHEYVCA